MATLKAAVLIVSTTAAKNPSADSSGSILKEVFEQEGGGKWEVVETKIVGDVVLDIQRAVTSWADQEQPPNLIITTGGTGFAINDSTPEVGVLPYQLEAVIDKWAGCHSITSQAGTWARPWHACSFPSRDSL